MPQAQCELGLIYEHGLGVPLDYKKSLYWSRLAAEQEYAEVQAERLTKLGEETVEKSGKFLNTLTVEDVKHAKAEVLTEIKAKPLS
ncbi:MAG: hypothetical protein EB072_04010 [Betaproteobacteria bacterium]|nr:hypothetical protein [Betaproteobacteria bacterium]